MKAAALVGGGNPGDTMGNSHTEKNHENMDFPGWKRGKKADFGGCWKVGPAERSPCAVKAPWVGEERGGSVFPGSLPWGITEPP